MADQPDKPQPSGSPRPEPPESNDPAQRGPRHSPRTQADKAARQARLGAEMRHNLLKRKRQQRARDGRTPQGD
jgi:hypothetical protein